MKLLNGILVSLLLGAGASHASNVAPSSEIPKQFMSSDLAITSPKNGTILKSGQIFKIAVKVNKGHSFKSIGVVGKDLFLKTKPIERPPYEFSAFIASDEPGDKNINAVGFSGSGEGVFSKSVVVHFVK